MPTIGYLIAEASGEVRDADGNLLNQEPAEDTEEQPDDTEDEDEDK